MRDIVWFVVVCGVALLCCVYVDRRATQTELYVTTLVVDASTGFQSWRQHVRRGEP